MRSRGAWLLLLLTACGPGEDAGRVAPANRKPNYFDVKGFLDAQTALLNQRQPAVEKQVQLRNGETETSRVTKLDWGKELQIFYQADINKLALRGAYAVAASGAARSYRRKAGVEAPVAELHVSNAAAMPSELKATIIQDNQLFYSEKQLRLHTLDGQLTDYEVRGMQKLIMFDTVRYSVRAQVK